MAERALQPPCAVCGRPVEGVEGGRAVRCAPCFDQYLRSVDAGFLQHFAEFGARSRRVMAETCLRALVLANVGDRKLLGMQVYEQFVGAASDLIALVAALRARSAAPLARTFLDFRLDREAAAQFFADVAALGGVELLTALGLPSPERVPPGLGPKVERDLVRALREVIVDLGRLNDFCDLGQRALVSATDHFGGGVALIDRTAWLAGRELTAVQVASVALDAGRGRLDIAALRVDEERLAQVVDSIDVMTHLTRNLIHAFLTVHEPAAFLNGFADAPRVRAG